MSNTSIVIVGAGMAGARVVIALRAADYCVSSTLISEETHLTYDRPTLPEPAITSDEEPTPALLLDDTQLRSLSVNFIRDGKALKLDVKAKTIFLGNGVSVRYEKLLITTSAKPPKLNIEGGEHALTLRKFADVENFHAQFKPDKKYSLSAVVSSVWNWQPARRSADVI